jgi:hypothetical protein
MTHLIPDINSNLQTILDWFKELHKVQQETIADQLGDSFPFLNKADSHQTTPEEIIGFLEEHLQDSASNLRKALLFYSMIRAGIEMILYDMPSDPDEYFDWYNKRKSFYDGMEEVEEKHGFEGIFSRREELMKNQFELLIHTKSSWLDAATKLKF